MDKPMTMGAYLNAARLRRRVSIDRAAEDTRIKRDFLMRMESDEFDFLSPAYVRGFLRTYASYLQIDPIDPLLDEFDRRHAHAVDASQIVALQRRARKVPREPKRLNNWVIALMAAVILLAVLGLVGLAASPDEAKEAAGREGAATPAGRGAVSTPSPSPSASPTVTESPAEAGPAEGVALTVRAVEEDCWVDITIEGVTIFSETVARGTEQTFTSDGSMTVVLGYPAGVQLTVNGEVIDSPGGVDPIKFTLPDDLESLR